VSRRNPSHAFLVERNHHASLIKKSFCSIAKLFPLIRLKQRHRPFAKKFLDSAYP
jgi:hypothetical protein